MPFLLNTTGQVICAHGGVVTLAAGDSNLTLDKGMAVRSEDLIGAPIIGCTQIGSGLSPCTSVVSIISGLTEIILSTTPYVSDSLIGVTSGSPINTLSCANAGQTIIQEL